MSRQHHQDALLLRVKQERWKLWQECANSPFPRRGEASGWLNKGRSKLLAGSRGGLSETDFKLGNEKQT